jgi:ankyrin repeat protein
VDERAQAVEVVEVVKAGDGERLRTLIAEDPTLAGARDEQGLSVVLHARYRDRQDLVEILLAAAPQLDIFEAAAVGAPDRAAELLDADPSAVHAWSADGYTPLHLAAFFGHTDAVRLLLGHGADPSAVARNPMEVMPLHSAMAGSDVASRPLVAQLLLEHGADVTPEATGGSRRSWRRVRMPTSIPPPFCFHAAPTPASRAIRARRPVTSPRPEGMRLWQSCSSAAARPSFAFAGLP